MGTIAMFTRRLTRYINCKSVEGCGQSSSNWNYLSQATGLAWMSLFEEPVSVLNNYPWYSPNSLGFL